MLRVRRRLIAPEGLRPVLAVAVAASLIQLSAGFPWAVPLWLSALALAWLFRDPDRVIPPAPLGIVSPADGTVTACGETHDDFLGRDAVSVTIRMRHTGVYVIRAPGEGKVNRIWTNADQCLTKAGIEAGIAIWIQTDEQDDIVVVIREANRLLRSSCYVHAGERIGQGQRCGLTPFGAVLEVFMPTGSRAATETGSRVKAGSDLIGTLIRK